MSNWSRKLDVLIRADVGRDVHARVGETRAGRCRARTQGIAWQAGPVTEKRASYGESVARPSASRGMSTRDIEAYLREQGPEFWMQVLSEPGGSAGGLNSCIESPDPTATAAAQLDGVLSKLVWRERSRIASLPTPASENLKRGWHPPSRRAEGS